MKPYASYKPSGVAWLGDVPAHWRIEKVKFQARLRGDKAVGANGVRYVGMEHVLPKVGKFNPMVEGTQEEAESTVNVFFKGDVLFGKLRPYLAKCVVADTDGVCSSEFLVLSPSDEVVPAYLNATMLMQEFIDAVDASTYGAKMPRADWGFIGQQRLPLPPPDEQQAIADYLDTETARIDTLVQEKEELIGLLREWRQSMIAEAVTKGMEKTVVFNSHPDPWIGFYPTHWKLKKLKYLGAFRAGAGFPVELQGQVGNPLPFFKVKDIDSANEHGVIRESDSTVTPETALSLGAKVFPPDAIVFAKVGAALLLNRFRLLGVDSCIDNNMMGLELNQEIAHPRFMLWAMQRINFSEIVNPGTVPSLNEPLISNLQIVVPPPDEQQAIAKYLDDETAKIDALITHTQEEIALLKELRAATIADAVLGRVDVRSLTQKQ